jgi:hypothetical protein
MKYPSLIVIVVLWALNGFAQVQVDKPIQLTGSGGDAKLTGIQQVSDLSDAASATSIQKGALVYSPAGGSANALTVTLAPAPSAYTEGMIVTLKTSNAANTGAVTLNVNGLGVKSVTKSGTSALAAGDLSANQVVSLVYDGTQFQLIGGGGGSSTPGNALGDMLYWNGSQWILLPIGSAGSFLKVTSGGIPGWIGLPALTTTAISSVTPTTAVSGGNVTADNGEPVTSRGIVYSTSPNPTLLNTVVYSGSGTGSFTSNLSGLSAGTVYYVRAFATNAVGTAYGNEISFTSAYTIGMNVLGGYVVYVDGSGIHGVVSASSDATDADWGCYGTVVGGTSTALGTGQASTNAIMTGCGTANIAARRCDALSSGGQTDWYLPSRDELTKVWEARWTYGISALNTQQTLYWSSSEVNNNGAWAQSFTSNVGLFETNSNKGNTKKVRCVRTF